jgi:hypothetical protein
LADRARKSVNAVTSSMKNLRPNRIDVRRHADGEQAVATTSGALAIQDYDV